MNSGLVCVQAFTDAGKWLCMHCAYSTGDTSQHLCRVKNAGLIRRSKGRWGCHMTTGLFTNPPNGCARGLIGEWLGARCVEVSQQDIYIQTRRPSVCPITNGSTDKGKLMGRQNAAVNEGTQAKQHYRRMSAVHVQSKKERAGMPFTTSSRVQ